jgi:hypothetical protein
MARIVVGSPNLTQPLLLYSGLGQAMLEQHRESVLPKLEIIITKHLQKKYFYWQM